jgi:hypothetical protein
MTTIKSSLFKKHQTDFYFEKSFRFVKHFFVKMTFDRYNPTKLTEQEPIKLKILKLTAFEQRFRKKTILVKMMCKLLKSVKN